MRILILSDQNKFSRAFDDFYPFYRWNKFFKKDGIHIKIIYNHSQFNSYNYDYAIISTRVIFENRKAFGDFLIKLKQRIPKVLLYDTCDTSGIVDFDLLKFVDGMIKKQVLKNREFYLENKNDLSVRPWLKNMPKNPSYLDYTPAKVKDLNKILVGWNVGLCDYRNFPLHSGLISNYYTTPLKKYNFDILINNKRNLTSFRGALNYGNPEISFQRNEMLKYFKESKLDGIITGGKINKSNYLKELRGSKIVLSPFGFGEICYRDFEAMLSGSLLIKPTMNHVDTFPDLFIENETYIPLNWDLSDLNEKIIDINSNYGDYIKVSRNAFEKFYFFQNSYNEFKMFFLNCIGKV